MKKKTVNTYNMKSFNCEICKTPYPLRFKSENNFYDIIEYIRPVDKNYIILESLNQLKDNNNYKSIQVITLEENEKIILGRGHETDVRINDISVSRTHAMMSLIEGKIIIKDLKSKFGTLVLIQHNLELTEKIVYLQIGRTFGEFGLVNQKQLQKSTKETVKAEDKQGFKSKQVFQVDKQNKKENDKNQPSQLTLNAMEVDNENENLQDDGLMRGVQNNLFLNLTNLNNAEYLFSNFNQTFIYNYLQNFNDGNVNPMLRIDSSNEFKHNQS